MTHKCACPLCTPVKPKKKRAEFSKRLAIWATIMATATVVASYVLAALDKQPVSEVTIAVFSACIVEMVAYGAKSLGEKMSRNKHGLDADGNPVSGEEHTDD